MSVYYRLKFTTPGDTTSARRITLDLIHARPERLTKKGKKLPTRFDTAFLNIGLGEETGVQGMFYQFSMFSFSSISKGYRVGQVRIIFTLPDNVDGVPAEPLAYVEQFSKFATPNNDHRMFKLNRSLEGGERVVSVIPVSTIRRSVHLFPKFGPVVPEGWSSDNVLERCSIFYLNPFTDRHMYFIL